MSSIFYNSITTKSVLLRILEHMSHIKLCAKYTSHNYSYTNIIINNLIFNRTCNVLSKYKDYLIINANKEYIHRFYSKNELKLRLKKISFFYEKYSKIFPNYIILYENKYLYKNIRKKQKMIDAVNKLKKEKNLKKEYEINNNCFDNEVFKGQLFTDEVEYEIAKDNIINNSNYLNEKKEDSLFTQHSITINNNTNEKADEIESFITNNESNGSLYNIIDILNENKIYAKDLRLLIDNNENINYNNINVNNFLKINNKNKINEDEKKIFKKGNISGKNINKNNIQKRESNNDLVKTKKINDENNLNNKTIKKNNNFQKNFPTISSISGKIKKTRKIVKNKDINVFDKSEIVTKEKDKEKEKDKKISSKKIIHLSKNNSKQIISQENNNCQNKNNNQKKPIKKLFLNNNINDYIHLETLTGIETINNNPFLLTKASNNLRVNERKIKDTKSKSKSKDKNINLGHKKQNTGINKKLNSNQINTIKKYNRYKHISQDFSSNYNKSKDKEKEKEKNIRNHKLCFSNNINNNLDKTNPKIKKETINSKSNISTSKIIKSNKDLKNLKNMKKTQIINNQIIIHNNNNYFLTENNNPNLITGTNKINYDTEDCDNEREQLLIYLKDAIDLERRYSTYRKINSQDKNKKLYNNNPFLNVNTEAEVNNTQKIKKIKNGKYLKDLIMKHKTEKKFKKNYKYYFNNINNNTSYNYPTLKYNTIRQMHYYKRNNSNFTERIINSNNSISKIKKFNSNYSLSPNKEINRNNSIKKINTNNYYSKNENKSKSNNTINNNRIKNVLISKTKTINNFKNNNKKYLQVSDIICSDSSRNILSQRLRKKQPNEFIISSTKEDSKNTNQNRINKILIIDNNKNITINSFNTENNKINNDNSNKNIINKIESYKNKRQNTDMKFNSNLVKNKFSSCDFDAMKNGHSNFSKGLLERINNIKSKINDGIYINNQSNLIKQNNIKKNFFYKINNFRKNKDIKENKTNNKNNKTSKIYENKIIYNINKENIPQQQSLIKVNKTRYYYGNIKSQLYINTDTGESVYNDFVYS